MSANGLTDLAVCIGAGWLLGLAAHWLKQPVLLGYLLAGFLIGPRLMGLVADPAEVAHIAELGLILLLFLLGLEMDFKQLRRMGRVVLTTALTQVVGSGLVAFIVYWAVVHRVGGGGLDALYAAVVASMSSTIIGIKLLHDKHELGTLAGQITLGVLVLQDLVAILFVGLQPTLLTPSFPVIAMTLWKIVLLVGLALLTSRYVLPAVFAKAALRPELVVLGALGWCFIVVACADALGLSSELGAITAGMAISTFPYALDIEAKVASLRDVFVTLFFVTVGLTLQTPDASMIANGLLLAAVVVVTRFLTVFAPVYLTGGGARAGFIASLNLVPVSELALVMVALGLSLKHLQRDTTGDVVFAFALLAFTGTYAIEASDKLYRIVQPILRRLGFKESPNEEKAGSAADGRDIFLLGFYRLASSMVEELSRRDPAALARLTVIDFNPVTHDHLRQKGVRVLYGDVGQRATLERAGIKQARLVLATLSGWVLKGIPPERLIRNVRALNSTAKIVAVGDTLEDAPQLRAAGADLVVLPRLLIAEEFLTAIRAFDSGLLEEKQAEVDEALVGRREILS